ncbi:MAG TPA: Fe-S cluster assembly protein SufD [Steroidobacteraceae bacterium]|jgi:Fe-S cluster assembly protein SufD
MSSASAAAPSNALRSFEAQWSKRTPDTIAPVRAQAMQKFLQLGLPTSRDESWRYTNLRALDSTPFVDAPRRDRGEIEPSASVALLDASQRAATIVMVNGYPWLQTIDSVINDIEVSTLREMYNLDPKAMLRFLDPLSDADERRFDLLNTALFVDGLYLKVTKNVTTPLVILHVGIGTEDEQSVAYPRIVIEATPGASAVIIEHHVSQGLRSPLVNSHTHLEIAHDARLEHYRVFATGPNAAHIDSLNVRQHENSHLKQFTIALGGGMVRAGLDCQLARSGAEIENYNLLVGYETRHVDCVNVVRHSAPRTKSSQTARAIASDSSRVIFNSKVIVNQGAAHAESQQSSRGLLLSQNAEIDSRPQLEIHADEVKCSHGATTGRLSPEMLFYLLSRGLDRNEAQSLLVFAFLADVLTGMSLASARTSIENALISQLPDSQLLRNFR